MQGLITSMRDSAQGEKDILQQLHLPVISEHTQLVINCIRSPSKSLSGSHISAGGWEAVGNRSAELLA